MIIYLLILFLMKKIVILSNSYLFSNDSQKTFLLFFFWLVSDVVKSFLKTITSTKLALIQHLSRVLIIVI